MVRRWPSVRARGVVLVAPLRGACARPCPLRRRAARPRASVVLRPLRRPRVPFRGGPGPPRRCPPSFAAPCSPSGCCAALRPRSPSGCAGLLLSCPRPGLGRRVGRCGRCAACSLPCARGAPPPSAASPFVRVGAARCPPRPLVPASLRPRGLRRVVPAPRRPAPVAAARLRLGAAPPCQGPAAAGPGGRAAAGGLLAAAAAAAFVALCAPPRGVGVPPLRRRFFRGCCGALLSRAARRGLASPALLSALPSAAASCALTAALLPRGLFAPPAHFVVQGEVELQGITRSTTCSAGLLLDIQNKLRIRQNSYYFAELFVDFVNRHCPILLVCSY